MALQNLEPGWRQGLIALTWRRSSRATSSWTKGTNGESPSCQDVFQSVFPLSTGFHSSTSGSNLLHETIRLDGLGNWLLRSEAGDETSEQ